jgi:hypothetical protein
MTPLDAALYWQARGISTVPLYWRSKVPVSRALIRAGYQKDDGSATWLPLREQLPTETQIAAWFEDGRAYNLALITTPHLVVVDFDRPLDYARWVCWQMDHNPGVVDTYCVTTSRGIHLYYRVAAEFEPIKALEPFEVKSHGKLVTIPPSVHSNGAVYRGVGSPDKIITAGCIEELLTFVPVKFERPVCQDDGPWSIEHNWPEERVNLLELFPNAKRRSDRYYQTDCPIHGHKNNFWLDLELNICGCWSGCGTFLASEIAGMIGDKK